MYALNNVAFYLPYHYVHNVIKYVNLLWFVNFSTCIFIHSHMRHHTIKIFEHTFNSFSTVTGSSRQNFWIWLTIFVTGLDDFLAEIKVKQSLVLIIYAEYFYAKQLSKRITVICKYLHRASDFFQDWWAEVTHGTKNGGSFSEMMVPSISN